MRGATIRRAGSLAFLPLVAGLVTLVGCVTPLSPGALLGRINNATAVKPYPFVALGNVTYTTPAGGGSGAVALAVEGAKFRLEATDPVGATRLAVASDGRRLIRIDPATGMREERPVGRFGTVPLGDGGIDLPTGLLQTAVTAALPPTGPLTAAFPSGSSACFSTVEPVVTFCVDDEQLDEVWFLGDRDQRIVMRLGPESGDAPLHRRWVKVTDRQEGIAVEIRWTKVTKGVDRPEGFFTFADLGEW